MPAYFIGLMSGTSLDGVDGVLADFEVTPPRVLAHASAEFDPALRAELLALNTSGPDELHRAALATNRLVRTCASVVQALLAQTGLPASGVVAIGAHGQTVRHRPGEFDGAGYTLQLNNPSLLAELTGIDVIADFRSRDVAAGGQGAPLAPLFHQAFFSGMAGEVSVLNIGGITNLTLLSPDGSVSGFDCGPGNALMDLWCAQHKGEPFDRDGAWAAGGRVHRPVLSAMLDHGYFRRPPPKSTGRDLFNHTWLEAHLARFPGINAQDVQATLAELTASACAQSLREHGPSSTRLLVCGGGALNVHLMARLAALLPGVRVESTSAEGLPPLQVEALAFAWLACRCVRREPLDLQKTTGARGARVLGGIFPR